MASTLYEGLLEHHLRIGDTQFYVPPTAISVHRQMKNNRVQILRARNSLPKESGYYDQIVEFTLFFPNRESINNELRPLLAQVKKCPFLPVENHYLNNILKIEALTISGVTIQTTPGFPNTLQAQIQAYAFDHRSYITDDEDRTFDEMINWELFRWYYQRNLDPTIGNGFNTYYEPLWEDLDDSYKFRIVAEDDLEAMKAWKEEKKKLIKDYLDGKEDSFWSDEYLEEKFGKDYDKIYGKAMFEYDLHYEDWDIPGLILTDFSIGFENTITSLQLQEEAIPTHQYMGSQDTVLMARFKTNSEEVVASLESLLNRSTYLIRNYHKEAANGFLEFDHPLARLFGVKNVAIEDVQTNTIEGQPGTFEITLTMCAYNRIERKLNEVKWLSETAEWSIDKYEDQGIMSILTSILNPLPDPQDPDLEFSDYLKSNPLYRIGRFLYDRPVVSQIFSGLQLWWEGHERDVANLDKEDIKQLLYDQAIKEFFRAAEVYPDLELPTYGELEAAGFNVENTNDGVFVDPDFFIDYHNETFFSEQLFDAMKEDYLTTLRDGTGGEAYLDSQSVVGMNDVTQKEVDQSREDYNQAKEDTQVNDEPIPKEKQDEGNISTSEMEALIREKASNVGLNQSLAVAFAKVMDSELKQFYNEGTNASQGSVRSTSNKNPIMMDSNFSFYTSNEGAIDGEYIGVMKVRRTYGSNINLLGKNIEYNVEIGVDKMSKSYSDAGRIFGATSSGIEKIYNEQYVLDTFGLKNSDTEKARYAETIMMYLGFENELTELVKNNKKPPKRLINTINEVLSQMDEEDEWSVSQIQKETEKLPIKDFRESSGEGNFNSEQANMTEKDMVEDNAIHKGMMHDMIRYDKRGRLVRAFPTFFMAFIDEGQYVGTIKLSDQYFQFQAVQDIMYTNSRKEASSTLHLEMSNIYGTLDDAEKGMDLTNTSYGEVFKTLTMPGVVARESERSRHRNPNYYKSIMLRTGTRIHFRMGYGSNPIEMPTIMNGTITSIQNNNETISVVAQDDGIELTNKIRADVNETTDGGFLFSKEEPTEIVDELLSDSQGFFKNLWAGLSNKEFEEHSLGIMHFGSQGEPQGWGEAKSFFGGATAGVAGGALVGGLIGALAGGLAGGLFSGFLAGKDYRPKSEILMNVYQTTGLTNEEQDGWWNKVKDAFGIGKADEPGINIGLFDKSVWDVLNISASIGDDHIVAVHPFGFRNTIFSGKPYFPIHYDYLVDTENQTLLGTAMKPFRQIHAYDSMTTIIDNSIQTTETNMRTVGVGIYMNEGETDTTSPVYVDTNIWPEKQRTVNIDTSLNAKGVRLVENVPLIGGFLNKPFKWHFDEGVAIKITARGLSDYVRDMYDGYLTVMGDPSAKPYDQMWIYDTYNSITGPAEMKEVTQIMNHQVGYITTIKPDVVAVNSDRRSISLAMKVTQIAGTVTAVNYIQKKLNASRYAGNLPILNSLWASTVNGFNRMKQRFKTSKVTGKLYDTLTGKAAPYQDKLKESIKQRTGTGAKPSDIARWTQNGMLDRLQKLANGTEKNKLTNLIDNSRLIKMNTSDMAKLTLKAGDLMTSGTKKMKSTIKGGSFAKLLSKGGRLLGGPAGWISLAVESLGTLLLTSTIGEFVDRWLFMRQAVIVAPLSKSGYEFTAGLNGHKGSVVGDSPDLVQNLLTNKFSSLLLGMIGVNANQYSSDYQEEENLGIRSQANSSSVFDMGTFMKDIYSQNRMKPREVPGLKDLYDSDRKAALEQINKRLELLSSREDKAKYGEEETTWKNWIEKIGSWFTNLWEKIKGIFGGGDDGTVCILEDGTEINGKAVNLSSYFDVIGPKIEKEAEKQGLAPYAEIIKAKTMQESGGNYKRYPDVMQASESLGKPIGYIKDVDQSIQQGVKYFGQVLKKANGDIKMALQSYNFGGGFIDYCKKRNTGYSEQIAWEFSSYMVKKNGRISRIPPGYGDSKYVQRVLRYYEGDLPAGACKNSSGNSYPSVFGAEGKKKYRSSTGKELVDIPSGPWKLSGVSGPKLRQGTITALQKVAQLYGSDLLITSAWRKGDPNWHGTGWAVDLDTPNTMTYRSGKLRFPNGRDKENARKLAKCSIEAGFQKLYFGDWDIVQEMNSKYGSGTMVYEPAQHHNHLHLSYPQAKK